MAEKIFTCNWFNPVNVDKHLAHLKDKSELRFLEIGTFEGKSAVHFLDNYQCRLVTIDPCVDYPIAGCPNINPEIEDRIKNNLAEYGERVWFIKDYAHQAFQYLPVNYFDFVFIDGDHRAVSVYHDAVNSLDALKSGGLIIFDDYNWRYTPGLDCPDSPHDGIDLFIKNYATKIEVVDINFQVTIRKR